MILKYLSIATLTLAGATIVSAGPLSFSGNFTLDEDVVLIPFTVSLGSTVTIETTSFADGSKGFEPVLTLYDGAGNLFLQDATGGTAPSSCGPRSIDGASGFCLDAAIIGFLNAGSYTLALTESDNIPGGPTLADGFPQTGNGNFTGPEFLGSPGSFILFNGTQRNNDWALFINGADTPEPATLGIAAIGLLAIAAARRKSRRAIASSR